MRLYIVICQARARLACGHRSGDVCVVAFLQASLVYDGALEREWVALKRREAQGEQRMQDQARFRVLELQLVGPGATLLKAGAFAKLGCVLPPSGCSRCLCVLRPQYLFTSRSSHVVGMD